MSLLYAPLKRINKCEVWPRRTNKIPCFPQARYHSSANISDNENGLPISKMACRLSNKNVRSLKGCTEPSETRCGHTRELTAGHRWRSRHGLTNPACALSKSTCEGYIRATKKTTLGDRAKKNGKILSLGRPWKFELRRQPLLPSCATTVWDGQEGEHLMENRLEPWSVQSVMAFFLMGGGG